MDLTDPRQFVCMCGDGFDGETCEERISPCAESPCSEGATCIPGGDDGTFQCMCPPGFTGELCSENIDECATALCENGATCVDLVDDFMCLCPGGFTGSMCSVPVLFCAPDSCANAGTCIEAEGGFECECAVGFTGPRCSMDIDECASQPCSPGSTCVDTIGGFLCLCSTGFTGPTCDTLIDLCSNDSCSFRGTCMPHAGGFTCACEIGFTGDQCEVDVDECEFVNCLNGGTCIDGQGVFMCLCDFGYTGTRCDIDIDECANSPCANGGTCTDLLADFSCECPAGFTGPTCAERIDFCADVVCFNGGTCMNLDAGFECGCPVGWSGERCQYPDNVVVKLDSCEFPNAADMLLDVGLVDSSEPLSITSGSPSVSVQYNLQGSVGLYFSGWIWQQAGTSSVLFSFDDDSTSSAAEFISDLVSGQVRFYYSSLTGHVLNATFDNVPLRANDWMHLALAVFENQSIFLNVDGSFSQSQTLQSVMTSGSEVSVGASFEVPTSAVVTFARGVTQEPVASLDPATSFSGLVRGVAINAIRVGSGEFDLDALQNCTLSCVGGEGACLTGGRCLDLFGPERRCDCPYGYTGLRCQQQHQRFSFDGSGFAQTSTQESLQSLSFSFKTDQMYAEIYSHSHSSARTEIQLRDNRTVGVNQSYCDDSFSAQDISATQVLNDLQYHTFSLSDSIQLDSVTSGELSLTPPASCNDTFSSSFLLGSFDTQDQSNNFQGCLRDITFNNNTLDASSLQLIGGAEFGCTRDTAQFHTFSHLELPQFLSRESQRISLEFSTLAQTGILYFSRRVPGDATGNMPNDFIAIHMQDGRATFTFNLGELDQNVVLQSAGTVNDGLWHSLTALQNGTMAALYVDGELMQADSTGPLVLLDTTGSVFVGGVPQRSRIAGFSSYSGFDGCVRDLEQNGFAADLQGYISQTNVRFGVCN